MESADGVYRIKNIQFQGSQRRILLQSKNGPCPLLAVANVLLLRNQMHLSQDLRYSQMSKKEWNLNFLPRGIFFVNIRRPLFGRPRRK